MNNRLQFNKRYFLFAVLIFCTEILIARFAHDRIVRPYIGDLLVVILIYCFVKFFFDTPVLKTALGVLLFAYGIEVLQSFDIITKLGLQDIKWARIAIGTSFASIDLIAYTAGIVLVICIEKIMASKKCKKNAGII